MNAISPNIDIPKFDPLNIKRVGRPKKISLINDPINDPDFIKNEFNKNFDLLTKKQKDIIYKLVREFAKYK